MGKFFNKIASKKWDLTSLDQFLDAEIKDQQRFDLENEEILNRGPYKIPDNYKNLNLKGAGIGALVGLPFLAVKSLRPIGKIMPSLGGAMFGAMVGDLITSLNTSKDKELQDREYQLALRYTPMTFEEKRQSALKTLSEARDWELVYKYIPKLVRSGENEDKLFHDKNLEKRIFGNTVDELNIGKV